MSLTKIQRPDHEEEGDEDEEVKEVEEEVLGIPNGVTRHGRRGASNANLLYSRQQIKELLTLCHVDCDEGVRFLFQYFVIIITNSPLSQFPIYICWLTLAPILRRILYLCKSPSVRPAESV